MRKKCPIILHARALAILELDNELSRKAPSLVVPNRFSDEPAPLIFAFRVAATCCRVYRLCFSTAGSRLGSGATLNVSATQQDNIGLTQAVVLSMRPTLTLASVPERRLPKYLLQSSDCDCHRHTQHQQKTRSPVIFTMPSSTEARSVDGRDEHAPVPYPQHLEMPLQQRRPCIFAIAATTTVVTNEQGG